MSIAVDNRERAWIHEPEPWLKRGIEYCFEHLAIGQREIVSELVKESGQMIPEAMDHRPEFRTRKRNSGRWSMASGIICPLSLTSSESISRGPIARCSKQYSIPLFSHGSGSWIHARSQLSTAMLIRGTFCSLAVDRVCRI